MRLTFRVIAAATALFVLVALPVAHAAVSCSTVAAVEESPAFVPDTSVAFIGLPGPGPLALLAAAGFIVAISRRRSS